MIRIQQILFNKTGHFCMRRFSSKISEDINRQNDLFVQEQKRQKEKVGRIEKIEVQYEGVPENSTLVMNKNLSTPYDCARHINEVIANRSVVALINDDTLWHMHKPIPESCKLQLLHFKSEDPTHANKAFWRTCSFLLGAVINDSFKNNVEVLLHSFPSPNVRSGSFIYDVQLSLDNWVPEINELKVLSIEMIKFCRNSYPIECLDVSPDFALDVFKNNSNKTNQIPSIATSNNGRITLFKAGKHIDISKGPMIANTDQIGRMTVANVIKLDSDLPGNPLYRFQGVALPSTITINHFAYGILEDRAKKLNSARIPSKKGISNEDSTFAVTQMVA